MNATGGSDEQTSGATFRVVVDLSDWDRYFPLLFSRETVDGVAKRVTRLEPGR